MQLLIADDDDYTREGLMESIDWSKFGINKVIQARDGSEALRAALSNKPDIVLTDIRMPKLNGIEFAEKLIKSCPDSKLLFMSGYMEVAYLKSAIKLSAIDYIEKPIKLVELENAILKTVECIREKHKHDVVNSQRIELERQKLASMLKQHHYDREAILRLLEETGYPVDRDYVCLIVQEMSGTKSEDNILAQINTFWNEHAIPSIGEKLGHHQYLFILALKNQDMRYIKYLTESYLQQNNHFCIGIGSNANRLTMVSESYRAASLALERSFYDVDNRCFCYDEIRTVQRNLNTDLHSVFYKLLENNPEKLTDWFNSLCIDLSEMAYPRERVCSLFVSFAQAMLSKKNTLITQMDQIYNISDVEQYINSCHSILDIKQFMLELNAAYQEEVTNLAQYSRIVREVMGYIASHCSNADLDLREIADHMHLSTAHLGMLFKKETEITIKQYIGDYRVDLAKRLISNEYYKMNTISELCGYASPSYFTKVFKASTNLTPIEYRKMSLK